MPLKWKTIITTFTITVIIIHNTNHVYCTDTGNLKSPSTYTSSISNTPDPGGGTVSHSTPKPKNASVVSGSQSKLDKKPEIKKQSVELDIKSKKTTDQWSYQKNNKTGTYEPKDNYAFNRVFEKKGCCSSCCRSDKDVWETNDSSQYATKVVINESSSDIKNVTLYLLDKSIKNLNKSNKSWVERTSLHELDVSKKQSTYELDYTKDDKNKIYIYNAKHGFQFNLVKQNKTEIWKAQNNQYATKVEAKGDSSKPKLITVHLSDNTTKDFVKFNDKWFPTPVSVELDIKKTSSTDTFDVSKQNKVKTYTPKPGFQFNLVKQNKTEIWKSSTDSEHSIKVEFKDLGNKKVDIVIHMNNGKTKNFNKAGNKDPWKDVTPSQPSDQQGVKVQTQTSSQPKVTVDSTPISQPTKDKVSITPESSEPSPSDSRSSVVSSSVTPVASDELEVDSSHSSPTTTSNSDDSTIKNLEDQQNKLKESDNFKLLVEALKTPLDNNQSLDADKLKTSLEKVLQLQNVDVNVSSTAKRVTISLSREGDDIGAQGTSKTQVNNKELLFNVKVKEGNNQSIADTLVGIVVDPSKVNLPECFFGVKKTKDHEQQQPSEVSSTAVVTDTSTERSESTLPDQPQDSSKESQPTKTSTTSVGQDSKQQPKSTPATSPTPTSDGSSTPTVGSQPKPAEGGTTTTTSVQLVELDVSKKQSTNQYTYTKDDTGKVEIYTANSGYKFKKVKNGNTVVWETNNNKYGFKVILTIDDKGKTKVNIDFKQFTTGLTSNQSKVTVDSTKQQFQLIKPSTTSDSSTNEPTLQSCSTTPSEATPATPTPIKTTVTSPSTDVTPPVKESQDSKLSTSDVKTDKTKQGADLDINYKTSTDQYTCYNEKADYSTTFTAKEGYGFNKVYEKGRGCWCFKSSDTIIWETDKTYEYASKVVFDSKNNTLTITFPDWSIKEYKRTGKNKPWNQVELTSTSNSTSSTNGTSNGTLTSTPVSTSSTATSSIPKSTFNELVEKLKDNLSGDVTAESLTKALNTVEVKTAMASLFRPEFGITTDNTTPTSDLVAKKVLNIKTAVNIDPKSGVKESGPHLGSSVLRANPSKGIKVDLDIEVYLNVHLVKGQNAQEIAHKLELAVRLAKGITEDSTKTVSNGTSTSSTPVANSTATPAASSSPAASPSPIGTSSGG